MLLDQSKFAAVRAMLCLSAQPANAAIITVSPRSHDKTTVQNAINALLAALFSMLFASEASAANYYVDNSSAAATNSNAGTSPSSPWETTRNVSQRQFQPGDVIAFKAGTTYSGGVTVQYSGSADAPITITSYGAGSKPVIQNNATPGTYSDAIILNGASHIVVNGLTLSSASHAGVDLWNSSYNVVSNNEIFNTGLGVNVAGPYNLVTGNYIHDLTMVVNNGTASNYGAVGVDVVAPNTEVSYNTCLRCVAVDNYYGYNGKMIELYGPVDNSYIHDNFAEGSTEFLEGGVGSAQNVRIVNNVSYNNNGHFLTIHYTGGYAYTGQTSFFVANNTAVELAPPFQPSASMNYINSPPSQTSIVLTNNIMVINQMQSIYKNNVPRNNNIYYMLQSNAYMLNDGKNTLGANEQIVNPQFANMNGGDFHLTATSPARGAGVGAAAIGPVDLAGDPIPSANPDIGAYQYSVNLN